MFRPELGHLVDIERKRIVMPQGVRMRLSRLEKPEPWPAALLDEVRRTLPLECMQQYPNYQTFYARLADFAGVDESKLVVGAGIEEFIRLLMAANFGRTVITLWPTCAMVDVYAKTFCNQLWKVVTDPHEPPSADDVIDELEDDVGLLLLANPGQPVETCYSLDELRAIARKCAQTGTLFAIDEAYHGFGAPSALPLVDEFANVVVLRTFSKAFGAAGLRLGYAVAGPLAKAAIDAARQSGEVSAFSMHVATVLMDCYLDFVAPSIRAICASRDWLCAKLRRDGFSAWGSVANHVLVDLRHPTFAAAKANFLAAQGIHVRSGMPAPLDSCLLITCGSPGLMQKFYGSLLS